MSLPREQEGAASTMGEHGLDASSQHPLQSQEALEMSSLRDSSDSASTNEEDSTDDESTWPQLSQRVSGIISQSDRQELERIATTLSRRMSYARSEAGTNAKGFSAFRADPTLDPQSEKFDVARWVKVAIRQMEAGGYKSQHTGVVFKDLSVYGSGEAIQLQQTVGDMMLAPMRATQLLHRKRGAPKTILNRFNGLVNGGELLVVLGRPGSGCSTLLKSICGELHGLQVDEESSITYRGVSQKEMLREFKGEILYNQEVDKHFPQLTVSQTLEFAAACREADGAHKLHGMTREEVARYRAQVIMAVCGLSHTNNTKVGNDFVRGVSGGERKRVSIAEMLIAGASLCAWDNSTRGLDSASALRFVQTLRLSSDTAKMASCVAIYQGSQAIYDLFDKATVLYEGRQIYFGPADAAKAFFERQGWVCPPRQTTGDFLTAVTNPLERQAREGMEARVPRTPDEFERYWRESPEYAKLQLDISTYEQKHSTQPESHSISQLRENKAAFQGKHTRPESPFMISVPSQIRLTTKRAYQRIWNDLSGSLSPPIVNIVIALIVGSIYYGTPSDTSGLTSKGATLFMAILLNALSAVSEIGTLYSQRPIVEKHASYAYYHPATEAIAGVVSDIPIKFITAICFNVILYFFAGLRREAGPFFLFFLITFITTFTMSAVFRTMGAITKTVSQAMTLAGVLILALVIYTGYVISVPDMHPWFGWIRWINPIFYAFEILIANEFHGREFPCAVGSVVPPYNPPVGDSWICSTVGSVAGQSFTSGDAYIAETYGYYYSHVWRNFGILVAFTIAFMVVYFVASEINSSTAATSESLVFRRGHVPAHFMDAAVQDQSTETNSPYVTSKSRGDEEPQVHDLKPQTDIFTWKDLVYDIEIKGEPRRLLDHVAGWVKPGSLTALMGVSGAGKTTLLDVLAQRTTVGVVTGDMFVNGRPLDAGFQRKTGYVQQQDLHLSTATVRESLQFSALLRQHKSISKEEKFKFVESVIDMLNMRDFANAVVGVPGEGLNVEQRKLLTIGVELAARPKLLLFLDEPTSGLDSQSSRAICAFLRKLADMGQAVLCTIHQPSALLFQEFDRLLFLAKGGKTVYFGDIGENSRILLDYFESNGARQCGSEENPAEYMLDIVNNHTSGTGNDWHSCWNASPQRQAVDEHINHLNTVHGNSSSTEHNDEDGSSEFAAPLIQQLQHVTVRIFQQYWRMPSYIAAKWVLAIASGLFIGFSFYSPDQDLAGMSIVLFGVFMISTIFTTLVNQVQPLFVTQRDLYEVRERPSKAYSWKAFIIANIVVEIPYQIVAGTLLFACVYYPVAGIQTSDRQVLVLLFLVQFLLYASTVAHMTIAAMPNTQSASAIVTLLFMMSLTFCGVMQAPDLLPRFWIFMYRVSPITYWIGGIVATQLHDRAITCSASETAVFDPPQGQTCGEYLSDFLQAAPGQLMNPGDSSNCQYCSLSVADQYLASVGISWSERWRNFGIMWAYIGFNIFATVALYYLFRVKKWNIPKAKKRE
ncbi:unnamed protein product [Clonostachys byssicola]|uniref:ABC transporter domain-containing protein n=1 Tax=Clonostachys byssicola TaxID=160290 RepID=A0A9N9Y1Y3_9HYPO|nr:unnamed protein product [Clonostachys byssicola]